MAEGLALQIDGKWAVLSDNVSVDIENSSPVWGEGSSFTLPFELDIEPNRHIIGNSDQITGQSVFDVLDGKPAILYTLGIPVYSGIIKLEDEVEITEGKVDISLVSGNLPFNEMIEGMNCQDVELKDEIIIGTAITGANVKRNEYEFHWEGLPEELMDMSVNGKSTVNISTPYPYEKYCNARIMYSKPDASTSNDFMEEQLPELLSKGEEAYGINRFTDKIVLDANRPLSGLCFYVLYFLECLFRQFRISYSFENISGSDYNSRYNNDINRLAFFSTACKYSIKKTDEKMSVSDVEDLYHYVVIKRVSGEGDFDKSLCVANSKNFPNTPVKDVISAVKNAFGIKVIYDQQNNTVQLLYVRDILKAGDVKTIHAEVFESRKVENNIRGFCLKYNASEDDTAFNYNQWENVVSDKTYSEIVCDVAPYNKNLYIEPATGNAYRVKVNEEAKNEEELSPSLFKVAQFNKVEYGDCKNESQTETIEIGFYPAIQNTTSSSTTDLEYATYVDVEMKYPSINEIYMYKQSLEYNQGIKSYFFRIAYYTAQRAGETHISRNASNVKFTESESPLQTYAPGLTLGIMRGPGAGAEVKDYEENYDGEGGSKYVTTAANYAFHSDMVDDNGGEFDYNGAEDGGTGSEDGADNRFSLYLRAEKPIGENGELQTLAPPYAKRGLFDKFYTEYAYFVTHRKIVRISCRMEMADILNIDWTKRYHIGQYVGFVNKYNFSVDSRGISNLNLEIYYI